MHQSFVILSSDNVYHPIESRGAINPCRRTFKHFDALYVLGRKRKICRKMPGMRGRNVDTIQQDGNLVKVSSTNRDVRLYTKATALTDIHACG